MHKISIFPMATALFCLLCVHCAGSSSSGSVDLAREIRYNNVAKVRDALSSGTSISWKDDSGNTLLHYACYYRASTDVAELLLARGADVHAKNNLGYTPLHSCALNGCENTIRVLLKGGASKDARDNDGRTPYDRAKWVSQTSVLPLLEP
ncbi:MAG: hypothetical protein CVU65_04695 [Deltaproteobacteria bacterium HGW-Deltaproteobacteria-22]|jgi:ankyrin repeat protein|nr:MAG: hypothetical protein CVU65_04695 [Deltaproteobacteria bacterium HGW-Deltaproteobacteria-22]